MTRKKCFVGKRRSLGPRPIIARRYSKSISDQDFYQADKPSDYQIGPLGGPCYRPWNFKSKMRPPSEDILKCFDYLAAHWIDIAGSSLAKVTRPQAFTGNKARRLLVLADGTAVPPWGAWTYLSPDEEERRTFTRFRSAVNKAIAPHEVDHIEFVTERGQIRNRAG